MLSSGKRSILFVTLSIVLIVINIILLRQNKMLRSALDERRESSELHPGENVAALEGVDINGDWIRIAYGEDQRRTMILVFSPNCDYCLQNMPGRPGFERGRHCGTRDRRHGRVC